MSIRRLNRRVKTLAEKGMPGTARRRIIIRIDRDGKPREFHPTKGWRALA